MVAYPSELDSRLRGNDGCREGRSASEIVIPAQAGIQFSRHGRRSDGKTALRLHSRQRPQWHAVYRRHQQPDSAALAAPERHHRRVQPQYQTHRLVGFEHCDGMLAAITREKQLKKWNRMWKPRLIEAANPEWRDLATDLGFDACAGSTEHQTGFPPARE